MSENTKTSVENMISNYAEMALQSENNIDIAEKFENCMDNGFMFFDGSQEFDIIRYLATRECNNQKKDAIKERDALDEVNDLEQIAELNNDIAGFMKELILMKEYKSLKINAIDKLQSSILKRRFYFVSTDNENEYDFIVQTHRQNYIGKRINVPKTSNAIKHYIGTVVIEGLAKALTLHDNNGQMIGGLDSNETLDSMLMDSADGRCIKPVIIRGALCFQIDDISKQDTKKRKVLRTYGQSAIENMHDRLIYAD